MKVIENLHSKKTYQSIIKTDILNRWKPATRDTDFFEKYIINNATYCNDILKISIFIIKDNNMYKLRLKKEYGERIERKTIQHKSFLDICSWLHFNA